MRLRDVALMLAISGLVYVGVYALHRATKALDATANPPVAAREPSRDAGAKAPDGGTLAIQLPVGARLQFGEPATVTYHREPGTRIYFTHSSTNPGPVAMLTATTDTFGAGYYLLKIMFGEEPPELEGFKCPEGSVWRTGHIKMGPIYFSGEARAWAADAGWDAGTADSIRGLGFCDVQVKKPVGKK